MKVVTFLKFWRVYNPGQVAGFEPEMADALIAAGVAAAGELEGEVEGTAPATAPTQPAVEAPDHATAAKVKAAKVKAAEGAKDLGAPPVQGGAV